MKNSGLILLNDKLDNYRSIKFNQLTFSELIKKILLKKYFPKEFNKHKDLKEGSKMYMELDFKIQSSITESDKFAWAVATEQYFFTSDKRYIYTHLLDFIIINEYIIGAIQSEGKYADINNSIEFVALRIKGVSMYENKLFCYQENLNLKEYKKKNQNIKLNCISNNKLQRYKNI